MAEPFAQAWEGVQHPLVGPVLLTANAGASGHHQVFMDTQVAKNTAAFGHISHALIGDGIRCFSVYGLALKHDGATAGFDQTGDAFQQGGLAHAIATHQAHCLAPLNLEVQVAQDMAGTVIGVEAADLEQGVADAVVSPK